MPPALPDYREIETSISFANIKDQVAALLYAAGIVNDDEEVLDIDFDFWAGWKEHKGNVPIRIKLKKHQELEVVQH